MYKLSQFLICFVLLYFHGTASSQVFSAYLSSEINNDFDFKLLELDEKYPLCTYTYNKATGDHNLIIEQLIKETPFYAEILSTAGKEMRFLIKEKVYTSNVGSKDRIPYRTQKVGQGSLTLKSAIQTPTSDPDCNFCGKWVGVLSYHYYSQSNQKIFIKNSTAKHYSRVGVIQ